jgi:hypothetical protein
MLVLATESHVWVGVIDRVGESAGVNVRAVDFVEGSAGVDAE